jgi:hypothetical protein
LQLIFKKAQFTPPLRDLDPFTYHINVIITNKSMWIQSQPTRVGAQIEEKYLPSLSSISAGKKDLDG